MDNTVNLISTSLSFSNLWGIVGFIIPLLVISVLFGLGFYLLKKPINSMSNPDASPLGGSSDSSSSDDSDDLYDRYEHDELAWEYRHRKEFDDYDDFDN